MPGASSTTLVARLTAVVESINQAVDGIRNDLRTCEGRVNEFAVRFSAIEGSLTSLRQQVEGLLSVIHQGHGASSLFTRMALSERTADELETDLAAVRKDLEDLRKQYDAVVTAKMLTRGQIVSGVVGMIITAMLALGAILAQLFKP